MAGHGGVHGEVIVAGAWQSLQWLGPVGARGLLLHGANQEAKRASTGRGGWALTSQCPPLKDPISLARSPPLKGSVTPQSGITEDPSIQTHEPTRGISYSNPNSVTTGESPPPPRAVSLTLHRSSLS